MIPPASFLRVHARSLMLVLVLLPGSASAGAQARVGASAGPASPTGIPSLTNCSVPLFVGASPGGDIAFTVKVRDDGNFPVVNSLVSLVFACHGFTPCSTSPCLGCSWDEPERSLWTTSNWLGEATFGIRGGGVCGPPDRVRIYVDGIWLADRFWTSSDQNGNGEVDAADVDSVESRIGTTTPTADLDGSGMVTGSDVIAVLNQVGTTCSARAYTVNLSTSPVTYFLSAPKRTPIARASSKGANIVAAAALAASYGYSAEAANILACLDAGRIFSQRLGGGRVRRGQLVHQGDHPGREPGRSTHPRTRSRQSERRLPASHAGEHSRSREGPRSPDVGLHGR